MIWIILLLGFGLRLISLNQSLWMDEAISAVAVKTNSFVELITKFAPGDTHPPLYYLILKIWTAIFGYSEISLRLPSVILGAATIYVVYLIGKKIAGSKIGIVSSLLLATSGLHIYYSQEARMYALSTFAVSLAVYTFLKIRERAKQKDWIILSFSLFLIGITDYLPLLIIPTFWIIGLVMRKRKEWWKKLLISHLPLAVFALLWLPIFKEQSAGTRNYLTVFTAWATVLGTASLKELSLVWVKFILGRISFVPKILYGFIVLVASVPFVIGLFNSLKKYKEILVVWLWLLTPLALSFIGSIFIPGFSYFRLLFILPAFYLLTAIGLSNIRFGYLLTAAVVILNLVFSGTYLLNQNFWREDWKGAVSFLEENARGDEPVLMVYPEPFTPYRWYSSRNLAKAVSLPFDKNIDRIVKQASAVYTFDYLLDLTDPQRVLFQELNNRGFTQTKVYSFRGVGQIRYWQKI